MSAETPSTSCSAPEKEVVETAPESAEDPNQNGWFFHIFYSQKFQLVFPVIIVGPIMVGPEPMPITCPHCQEKIVTNIKKKADTKTHLFALTLCLVG